MGLGGLGFCGFGGYSVVCFFVGYVWTACFGWDAVMGVFLAALCIVVLRLLCLFYCWTVLIVSVVRISGPVV